MGEKPAAKQKTYRERCIRSVLSRWGNRPAQVVEESLGQGVEVSPCPVACGRAAGNSPVPALQPAVSSLLYILQAFRQVDRNRVTASLFDDGVVEIAEEPVQIRRRDGDDRDRLARTKWLELRVAPPG